MMPGVASVVEIVVEGTRATFAPLNDFFWPVAASCFLLALYVLSLYVKKQETAGDIPPQTWP